MSVILDMLIEARLDEREKILSALLDWVGETDADAVCVSELVDKIDGMRRG